MSRAGQAEILPNLLYSPTGALENRPSHVNDLWIQHVNIDRRFQATLNAKRTADSICNSTSSAEFFKTAVANTAAVAVPTVVAVLTGKVIKT